MEATIKIIEHHNRPMTFSNGKPGEDAANLEIGIVERGTHGGQEVIVFKLQTKDGKNIISEITARQFEALIGAFIGARQIFQSRVKMN